MHIYGAQLRAADFSSSFHGRRAAAVAGKQPFAVLALMLWTVLLFLAKPIPSASALRLRRGFVIVISVYVSLLQPGGIWLWPEAVGAGDSALARGAHLHRDFCPARCEEHHMGPSRY